jgi:hypothetical protein
MANQHSIHSSNNFEPLDSININTDTALFSSDTNAASGSVSHTIPKVTASSIHKHTRSPDDTERCTKKGYYFCKYCEPSDL